MQRCGRRLSGIMSAASRFQYEQQLYARNGELPANSRNSNRAPPSAPSPPPPQSSSANHGGDPAPPVNSSGSNDTPSSPPPLSQPSSTNQEGGPAPAGTGVCSNTPSTPLPQAQNPANTDETCRERYVLWCINLGRSQTTVAAIPVAAEDKDKQVFNKLRQAYKETRGWWRAMASLHTLAEIRYVKVSYSAPSYVSAIQ